MRYFVSHAKKRYNTMHYPRFPATLMSLLGEDIQTGRRLWKKAEVFSYVNAVLTTAKLLPDTSLHQMPWVTVLI